MIGRNPAHAVPIAVVERDHAIRTLWRDLLADEGYAPRLFGTTDCITYQAIRTLTPATIILGMHLPGAEWRLFEQINTDPMLRRIPVILSTADDAALHDPPLSLQPQPVALLPQPFDVDAATALLHALVGQAAIAHEPAFLAH